MKREERLEEEWAVENEGFFGCFFIVVFVGEGLCVKDKS